MGYLALLIFGATFIYGGMLMARQEPVAAIACATLGIVMLIVPVMRGIRIIGQFRGVPHRGRRFKVYSSRREHHEQGDHNTPTYH